MKIAVTILLILFCFTTFNVCMAQSRIDTPNKKYNQKYLKLWAGLGGGRFPSAQVFTSMAFRNRMETGIYFIGTTLLSIKMQGFQELDQLTAKGNAS